MALIYFDTDTNTYGDASNLVLLYSGTVYEAADEEYNEDFHELGDAEQSEVVDSIPEVERLNQTLLALASLTDLAKARLKHLK